MDNVATNMKDCRCRQLPNNLQNLHLFCYTFLTVKDMLHKLFECLTVYHSIPQKQQQL